MYLLLLSGLTKTAERVETEEHRWLLEQKPKALRETVTEEVTKKEGGQLGLLALLSTVLGINWKEADERKVSWRSFA